ncbi:DEKNAAC101316 [Brettanomyces naardenensis]|uniref:Phospholipid scramblase n=1 Tax=Brettanomyces naardenensis TaxID=13370 RepID=A0A448YHS4_BRENA|nr:DEKNAAC101316 [Brettanomyces naardenensis]
MYSPLRSISRVLISSGKRTAYANLGRSTSSSLTSSLKLYSTGRSGGYRDTFRLGQQKPSLEYQAQPVFTENPNGLIDTYDPVTQILNQPTLVIQRQIEFMNLFLGFEQANKYVVMDSMGNQLGWLIERDFGILKAVLRQVYRLHRPFTVDLFDNNGNLLLTIRRHFSLINSHIKAILPNVRTEEDPDGLVIGESVQNWHLWRRRYDLFQGIASPNKSNDQAYMQFGKIDAGFLSWDFAVRNRSEQVLGAVSRNFSGLFREMFTDTGVYVVRMDPISFQGMEDYYGTIAPEAMTLDQKAVMLANAVSIDFDYFSRHSSGTGGFMFIGGDDI